MIQYYCLSSDPPSIIPHIPTVYKTLASGVMCVANGNQLVMLVLYYGIESSVSLNFP